MKCLTYGLVFMGLAAIAQFVNDGAPVAIAALIIANIWFAAHYVLEGDKQ